MKKISVLLADDHAIVREGLRALLEMEGDFDVVGEAANGLEAVDLAIALRPAVVVLDLAMPKLNGTEAARRILQQLVPPPKVLILSAHSDDAYVDQVLAIGAVGYLIKQTSAHLLAKAIRETYYGQVVYSPVIAKRLSAQPVKSTGLTRRPQQEVAQLTSREREVLQLVAEGQANKAVASDLGISVKTVEKHRQSVMRKLNIHDTAGLTRYAIAAGIIENCCQVTTCE